ncbi:hypothetical protein EST38_g11817, partial [Candolleomyces aberdarensis]
GEPVVDEPGGSAYLKVEQLINIHPPKSITFSRRNPFSIFEHVLALKKPGEAFGRYASQEWEKIGFNKLSKRQQDALVDGWLERVQCENGDVSVNEQNRDFVRFFNQVLSNLQELLGPIEIVSLIFTPHPQAQQLSTIVAGDPNFRSLLERQPDSTRSLIEKFINLAERLFGPVHCLADGASDSAPNNPIAGPSEPAGSAAAGAGAASSAIDDFRGLVSAYVQRNELPASIARIQNQRGSLRAIARMLIMGCLADLLDVPKVHSMWRGNIRTILVRHRLVLIWSSEWTPLPGDERWDTIFFSSGLCKSIITGMSKSPRWVRFERWSSQYQNVLESDRAFPLIPIIMSATGTVLAQVRDSPTWAGQSAYAAGATIVGGPNVAPLHAARDRKQLKIDATTYVME